MATATEIIRNTLVQVVAAVCIAESPRPEAEASDESILAPCRHPLLLLKMQAKDNKRLMVGRSA
jgi:hypothetical protein